MPCCTINLGNGTGSNSYTLGSSGGIGNSASQQTGILQLGLNWVGATALLVLVYLYAHYMFASTTAHTTPVPRR